MSMIVSWVVVPLVFAAVGLGWGALVGWAGGQKQLGVLTIPLGLAAAIVVAALFTTFSFSAPAAAPVVVAGTLAGLLRAWRRISFPVAAIAAGVGVLLVYGAPVILSGQDGFLGYVRLDDTATWLAFIDQFFSHGRSLAALPPSTYRLLLDTNLTNAGYPSGAFMLPGIAHWVTGVDAAWIFQPYLAVCASALALCSFDLLAPLIAGTWLRAFAAFIAAQSALLFGYAAWGGIKELTAAFLLGLGLAIAARMTADTVPRPRSTVPLAVAGAALIVTLGPGGAIYVVPAGFGLAGVLIWRLRAQARGLLGYLAGVPLLAALVLPSWLTLTKYLNVNSVFTSASADHATAYGNLTSALRAIQLSGIWLYGDFRSFPGAPSSTINHVLIYCVFAGALFALAWELSNRRFGLALYVAVALVSVAGLSFEGTVPWLMGKSLAISSPAVLLAGLAGAAILFSRERVLPAVIGVVLLGAIAAGVVWSNYLQYRNVTVAPRARLDELATIGAKLAGHGPVFFNEYEIYGDRHFLRDGAPVEPAEYRQPYLPTLGNAWLTDPAWANIDSFGLAVLGPYRSLVERISPTDSRPSSLYGTAPVWSGRFYQLWEQPARPATRVIEHMPLGDSLNDAYCGAAENVTPRISPLCPIAPASVPVCSAVLALGQRAAAAHGELLAYERPNPVVLRATNTQWSAGWNADTVGQSLQPTTAGATAIAHIVFPHRAAGYQLWLGGSFARGFVVSVDGRRIGSVAGALDPIGGFERVGVPLTLAPGTHTITVTYPDAGLSPGSADIEQYTQLGSIALAPPASTARYVRVQPAQARQLCGRTLDWIEAVAPA
jgi:hypothetical protein